MALRDRSPLAGRPRRGKAETAAIAMALAAMPRHLSARARARCLAARTVAEVLAAAARTEPFEQALAATRASINSDLVFALAHDPASDIAGELLRERVFRFIAREGTQICTEAWAAETAEIADVMAARLAERFRRAAQKTG